MVSVQPTRQGRTAKEILDGFEAGIRSGNLPPGELLPSVRALASELEVAAGTVASAYKRLRDRGLVQTSGRNGTRVSPRPPLAVRSGGQPLRPGVVDLASGQPDPKLLPVLRLPPPTTGGRAAAAPAEFVVPELLALGRERLGADGVPTEALTVTSGGLDAMNRLLSAQLQPGDKVAVEDPGWPNLLDLVAALGLRTHPLPLDGAGPLPGPLEEALQSGARAVIVTSRAQNPTGAALTAERERQLRTVLANHRQTLVIADDHAAELTDTPLASLAGATDSWALVRSTSKPFGPDLRVALISGDEATIARVDWQLRVGSGWVSTLLQRLVVDLWTDPEAATAVAHAARTYDIRRRELLDRLAQRGISGTGDTGLNVWVPVPDETATVTSLLQADWSVAPGTRFRQASPPGIRITVSALTGPVIPRLADDLAAALSHTGPRHYTS